MRQFVGNPKIKFDLENMEQIKEFSIAFCQYINAGGCVGDFADNMIDNVIDCAMKLKADRDNMYKCIDKDIPMYDSNGLRVTILLS